MTIQYKYNDSGIRTSKKVDGVETKYYLDGSKVIYETRENKTIYYTYNENGDIIGLNYEGNDYYYVKNIQNDIIGILNSNLEQIVSYEYDSWGQAISIKDSSGNNITDETNIGLINPYRYRSYRYDSETKLYYLNSRYYNPEWGRFINADGLVSTGQGILCHNMYAYCENNPINFKDETGTELSLASLISIVVVAVAIIFTAIIPDSNTESSAGQLIEDAVDFGTNINKDIASRVASRTKSKTAKTNTKTTTEKKDNQIVFPENPLDFNPKGLISKYEKGTKNGGFWYWKTLSGIVVFRWDEDIKNGSHYHILPLKKGDDGYQAHYWPLTSVPEPFATIFF